MINGDGINGEITLTQRSRFEPTWLNFSMASSTKTYRDNIEYARNVASFKITELPPNPAKANLKKYCATTGGIYNPLKIDRSGRPPPGYGTQEQYPIGDLSGKLQSRNRRDRHDYFLAGASSELSGIYWDVFLPLQGRHSVYHRGITVHRLNRTNPANITEAMWTCGVFGLYEKSGFQKQMFTAQILYRYPIVGRIFMRQPQEEWWQDTVVLIEYLIHADGAQINNTVGHRWAVHSEPPGKDFYNWTMRCLSAKEVYNPYKVTFDVAAPEDKCNERHPEQCRMGDLWNRLGTLDIAGRQDDGERLTRKMFTVQNFPLSGHHRVVGKSLVIYDDHGPVARGERFACSM